MLLSLFETGTNLATLAEGSNPCVIPLSSFIAFDSGPKLIQYSDMI